MTQLAGKIPQQLPTGHNGRADADVNEQQHKVPALPCASLMQRHGADVVFQIRGQPQRVRQALADVNAVPALEPGRIENAAVFAVQRPGALMPMPSTLRLSTDSSRDASAPAMASVMLLCSGSSRHCSRLPPISHSPTVQPFLAKSTARA